MSTIAKPPAEKSKRAAGLSLKLLQKWLHDMLLIREFEVRCMQAYQNKKIGGFCHVYIGQEAVAVGCVAAVRHEDPIITAYRDHGHALARGMHPKYCMAEMFGRIGGCAKGKGGSMHMFDKPNNMFGGHGIVGAQTALGAGLAFATKYEDEVLNREKSGRVTLCFLGDGALNQGTFHEAMNLAGILNLPIVFCVENNGYSMGTSVARGTTMGHDITKKGIGYDMKSATVEGMDVLEVYQGMKPLVAFARDNSRPVFVDIRTYRFKGHSMSDPRKYRTREEEEQYQQADPVEKLAAVMMDEFGWPKAEYDELQKNVRAEIRDAIEWADQSPAPPLEELYRDVYVQPWASYTGTTPPHMLQDEH